MLTDRYGLPLSTSSQAARDAYVEGADCVLSAVAGPEAHFGRALEADADFALAQAGLARTLFLAAQAPQARAAAARARELATHATPREQSHVNAIALSIEGKMPEALTATCEHVALYPRDAMVLAPATGVFGLIGFSGRQEREEELLELLRRLAPHYGADWWFQSMLAFAACECGRLDEAMDLIEQSLSSNPRNAHGVHILVHVLYEKGEPERASRYLDGWMPGFAKAGLLHCHLSWHVALLALELGKLDRAWEVYRADIHPTGAWGPPINVATDASAFLWRCELSGQPRQLQWWREVHD
ncbi:MAG TPA: tetratricopeptide repeat protein, partial [Burkholderiales bacterium]|nr:tetratricopeptide repeat protein [Burkholderiales bacterium]